LRSVRQFVCALLFKITSGFKVTTLREELRLRVLENKVLRRIFRPMKG
jgi:hypothetical protein